MSGGIKDQLLGLPNSTGVADHQEECLALSVQGTDWAEYRKKAMHRIDGGLLGDQLNGNGMLLVGQLTVGS